MCFDSTYHNTILKRQHDTSLKIVNSYVDTMPPSLTSPKGKKNPTARKSTGGPRPYIRPPTPDSPSPEPELVTLDSDDEDEVNVMTIINMAS